MRYCVVYEYGKYLGLECAESLQSFVNISVVFLPLYGNALIASEQLRNPSHCPRGKDLKYSAPSAAVLFEFL